MRVSTHERAHSPPPKADQPRAGDATRAETRSRGPMSMTVLYLETGSGYGGSSQSLAGLLSAIDRRQIRPIVVAYEEGSGIEKIRALGVPVIILGPPAARSSGYAALLWAWLTRELPRALQLVRFIRRERVDLVHLNTDLYSTVAGLWAARWTHRPVVSHIRLTRPPTRLERWLGRWVLVKVVLTEEARAFYQRWWPQDRVVCIANGVRVPDLADGAASSRAAFGIPPSRQVVTLIARCVPGKGYREFLDAAQRVSRAAPEVTFLIVGNGAGGDAAYEADLRRWSESLGLNGQVIWAGWQADPSPVYQASDIVVQASSTFPEGLSRVLMEAAAHGKPVIATDLVGNRALVTHQQTGLLVRPGDAAQLAEAMLTLLNDPATAHAYGRQGRQRVAESFSLEAMATQIMRLYQELVGR